MGRPEGPRCYCYVNNLLRKSLDGLSRNYQAVVLDNEAGMEHLSRRTTNDVDFLIAVANPAIPAIQAAQRVLALSRDLPVTIGHRALLVNRADRTTDETIASRLGRIDAERLADVPQDDEVQRAGAVGRGVFSLPADSPALVAVRKVLRTLHAAMAVAD